MTLPHHHSVSTNPIKMVLTKYTISTVNNYKYLGVVFNPKLKWRAHITKVITSALWWIHQLRRISKTTGGLSPSKTHQLYNTIVVPAFTYASDIWYTPPFKLAHSRNTKGSIRATKLLQSVQGRAARYITGSLKGTAYDVLEVHAYIPPIDLMFQKAQINAATHVCLLPPNHPLHPLVQWAA